MPTNVGAHVNDDIIPRFRRSQVRNGSPWADVKVSAGQGRVLSRRSGENLFSGVFQLLEASRVPRLVSLSSSVSPSSNGGSSLLCIALLRLCLLWLHLSLIKTLSVTLAPPGKSCMTSPPQGQLINNLNSTRNLNSPFSYNIFTWSRD